MPSRSRSLASSNRVSPSFFEVIAVQETFTSVRHYSTKPKFAVGQRQITTVLKPVQYASFEHCLSHVSLVLLRSAEPIHPIAVLLYSPRRHSQAGFLSRLRCKG